MAAAPSVVCDALPAVMSGAVSGSQFWAGGSAASASRVELRRMPSSLRRNSPVRLPSSRLDRHGQRLALEVPAVPARRGPLVRRQRVGVHLRPGDAVAVGQHLAHPELGPQPPVDRAPGTRGGTDPCRRGRSRPSAPGSSPRPRRPRPCRSGRRPRRPRRSGRPAATSRTGGRPWWPARSGAVRPRPSRCGSRWCSARPPGSRSRR